MQGSEDQFGAGALAVETAERHGFRAEVVPGADHFFTGKLDAFEAAATGLLVEAGLRASGRGE